MTERNNSMTSLISPRIFGEFGQPLKNPGGQMHQDQAWSLHRIPDMVCGCEGAQAIPFGWRDLPWLAKASPNSDDPAAAAISASRSFASG